MKQNKFISTTLILVIGGFITKVLGFIIRIIYTRIVKEEAISLYTLITPTYSLIVSIAAGFLPIALSKLISENKNNNQRIVFNSIILILIIDIILISITILFAKTIAYNLLKEKRTLYLIYSIVFTIPFISISSIFKGYFFGKQRMHPNVISNIMEQLIRIIIIITIIPKLVKINIVYGVIGFILINIITELVSCLVFISLLPKGCKVKKDNLKLNRKDLKEILNVSLPLISSRLIGNIGFFLEPILLTQILLKKGFSNSYILNNYGIYNAYAISLLTLPNFFIMAISSSIIPEISKYYSKNNIKIVQKRFKQALLISFLIGLSCSIFIFIFRNKLLWILYRTIKGSNYIKILGPVFVLFYIEGPLTSTLQAIDKAKDTFKITTIGILIKLLFISLLSYLKCGIYALIISEIINIFVVVILSANKVRKELF